MLAANRNTEVSTLALLGFLLSQKGYLRQTDANRAGIIVRICHTGTSQIQLRSVLHDTKLERHLTETDLIIHAALVDGARCFGRKHTDGMIAHTQRNVTELGAVFQYRSLGIVYIPIVEHTIQLDAAAIVLVYGLQLRLDVIFRGIVVIARNGDGGGDASVGIGNQHLLLHHLEVGAIERAHIRRLSPRKLVLIRHRIILEGETNIVSLVRLQIEVSVGKHHVPFIVDFLIHRLFIHLSVLIHIIIDSGGSPIVVRAFCRSIVYIRHRTTICINKAEVEFLFCIVGKRRHSFLQSPQFKEDGGRNRRIFSCVLIRTDRRALDNIHLGSLGIDAKIIEGIVGTRGRFAHVIHHKFEIGEIIHSALLLQYHLSISLIPFTNISTIVRPHTVS